MEERPGWGERSLGEEDANLRERLQALEAVVRALVSASAARRTVAATVAATAHALFGGPWPSAPRCQDAAKPSDTARRGPRKRGRRGGRRGRRKKAVAEAQMHDAMQVGLVAPASGVEQGGEELGAANGDAAGTTLVLAALQGAPEGRGAAGSPQAPAEAAYLHPAAGAAPE